MPTIYVFYVYNIYICIRFEENMSVEFIFCYWIRVTKCTFLTYTYICIEYLLPTFWGIHVSWRSSVHFVTYIFVSDICGQHLGDVCQLEVFCAPLMYILDICCPHLGNKCQLILYISPGPNCPGGPTVHFFRADSWAPDSRAPGLNCPP